MQLLVSCLTIALLGFVPNLRCVPISQVSFSIKRLHLISISHICSQMMLRKMHLSAILNTIVRVHLLNAFVTMMLYISEGLEGGDMVPYPPSRTSHTVSLLKKTDLNTINIVARCSNKTSSVLSMVKWCCS